MFRYKRKEILVYLKSELFLFLLFKYTSYILQFVLAMIIANRLGTYYFGIYSFLLLVLQYLKYSNLGIQYSLNVFLSLRKGKPEGYVGSSFYLTVCISFLLLLTGVIIKYSNIELFSKYSFNKYIIYVLIIASLVNLNELFINIYRAYGRLLKIGLYFFIIQFFVFIVTFLIEDKVFLLNFLLLALISSNFIMSLLFFINPPTSLKISFNYSKSKELLKRGFNLLIYNLSFYLMVMAIRTLVSIFCEIKELGIYSFSDTLARSVSLGLGAIGFVFFPKIINKTQENEDQNVVINRISFVRQHYMIANYFISIVIIILFPLITMLMPKYEEARNIFVYLIIAQMVISSVFGYTGLLISRGKERILGMSALIATGISVIVAITVYYLIKFDYSFFGIFVILSILLYSSIIIYFARIEVYNEASLKPIFMNLFPIRVLIPLIFVIVSSFFGNRFFIIINIIGLVVFIYLNIKVIISSIKTLLVSFGDSNKYKF